MLEQLQKSLRDRRAKNDSRTHSTGRKLSLHIQASPLSSERSRMHSRPALAFFGFALVCSPLTHAQSAPFFPPSGHGDGIRFPLAYSPAIWQVEGPLAIAPGTDHRVHLAYALRITNAYGGPIKIESIAVVDPFANDKVVGTNRVVAADNGDITALVDPTPPPPNLNKSAYSNTIPSGASGVMFLDVTFSSLEEVPAYVSQRLTVSQADAKGEQQTYITMDAPVAVDRRIPIVLAPPLRGDRWLDGDSCCRQIGGHRWAHTPVNGVAEAAETFAVDLLQLRKDGRVFSGPVDKLSSYEYYGASVYCAGAGKVVEVVRDLQDEVPGSTPTNLTVQTAAGNHVIIEMKGKRYAMYAHFAPHSVTVQVGDEVREGQLLGKLGNSGSTSAPHLHFQVMDGPSPLAARPLPFVFRSFSRHYRYSGDLNEEGRQTVSGEPLKLSPENEGKFENAMPLTFDLLDFE
jgi:hypothetical protein